MAKAKRTAAVTPVSTEAPVKKKHSVIVEEGSIKRQGIPKEVLAKGYFLIISKLASQSFRALLRDKDGTPTTIEMKDNVRVKEDCFVWVYEQRLNDPELTDIVIDDTFTAPLYLVAKGNRFSAL